MARDHVLISLMGLGLKRFIGHVDNFPSYDRLSWN